MIQQCEMSFLTGFSSSKAPMSVYDFYVRILDVYITLACLMRWYAYRVSPDARRGLMSISYASYLYLFYAYRAKSDAEWGSMMVWYAIVFVIIACVSKGICLYDYIVI